MPSPSTRLTASRHDANARTPFANPTHDTSLPHLARVQCNCQRVFGDCLIQILECGVHAMLPPDSSQSHLDPRLLLTNPHIQGKEIEGGARTGARVGVGVGVERNGCKDGMASRTTQTRWKRRGVGVRCAPPASSLPWPPLPASPATPCCVSTFATPVPWPTALGETSSFLYYPAAAPRTPASAVARLAPPVLPSPPPASAAPAPSLARCTADVDGVQHPRGNRSCVGSDPTSRSFAGSSSGSSTSFPFCSAPPLTTPTASSAPTATRLASARWAHPCYTSRFLH
ncbi:hypothetical protein DFH08DRAFT_951789 [Mycena albidolilacea]|uniref:Uncharacterized protein n=1 Tax=Mycena albidolilacea TaxID=1033008 RepID=A0AAD7AK19_9AGAR|nr:hypothetical protein DFH08DRAFT_951789 [Mycena albidolilacea]